MALPEVSHILAPPPPFPMPPGSWSALSWHQLQGCWRAKMRYGGNADVARAAALLSLCGLEPADVTERSDMTVSRYSEKTGEPLYLLRDGDGNLWTVTPRELSQMARKTLPWFDYPYGDPGDPVVKDERGKVVKEAREPVRGYVNENFRDALSLPEETVVVCGDRLFSGSEWQQLDEKERRCDCVHFALPQVVCNNLTWQQYRSLQAIVPQLFQEGIGEDDALELQAQVLANILVPAKEGEAPADRFAPKHVFQYSTERAEQAVAFWRRQLQHDAAVLYHICLQAYQTALVYYAAAYPLLFSDDGKKDAMRDALQGEVGTINAIMMKASYTSQQEVYDSYLPFILDILNTMTKEAKEIERINSKIKK